MKFSGLTCLVVLLAVTTHTRGQAFTENFDELQNQRWHKDGTWANDGIFRCTWSPANIWTWDGQLIIQINQRENTIYSGQMRTQNMVGYGDYHVWLKPINKSGVISAFFTYTGPPHGNPHDEIDIEFLGKDVRILDLTFYVNGKGTDPNWLVDPKDSKGLIHSVVDAKQGQLKLNFDPTENFYHYAFEWRKDHIAWYVDDVLIAKAQQNEKCPKGQPINIPVTPGYIMLNAWPAEAPQWVGSWDQSSGLPVDMRVQKIMFTPATTTNH